MQKGLFIISVCLFGVFVCWKSVKSDLVTDDLLLKNVEALAAMESTEPIMCDDSGSFTCPIAGEKVGAVYQGYNWEPDEETY